MPLSFRVVDVPTWERCHVDVVVEGLSERFPLKGNGDGSWENSPVDVPGDEIRYRYVGRGPDGRAWAEAGDWRVVAAGVESVHDVWRRFDEGALLAEDPYLAPYLPALRARYRRYTGAKDHVTRFGQESLADFSRGYTRNGFRRAVVDRDGRKVPGLAFREWAPGAAGVSIVGEFNDWAVGRTPCERDEHGNFATFLPDGPDGSPAIAHGSRVKLAVTTPNGETLYRLPAWIRYCGQDESDPNLYGVHWDPPADARHVWAHPRMGPLTTDTDTDTDTDADTDADAEGPLPADAAALLGRVPAGRAQGRGPGLRIYEAHVGMGAERHGVGTYREFADGVLPRVRALGYNAVQLMAVQEHAYYGSFGYHVTSFFAVAHRSGTPEDFKYLVDRAHAIGLRVIVDLVHSHASKNTEDGLNRLDGTDSHYFKSGPQGEHPVWDSRLFDYGNFETLRFLLSNARWFAEEYRVDGYRFDGVTSMLYHHHGLGEGFSGDYGEYLNEESAVDHDAVAYLTLVNEVLGEMCPAVITIAEDVSGMPTLCSPIGKGGVGFGFRLAMAVPDMWIKLLKEGPDEDWDMGHIVHTLLNRRFAEGTVGYAESHDQALVGDKTLAFRLMDKEMYDHMSILSPLTPIVDRGIALHKLIRLLSCALSGDAWLTFMGNEFGHPEWIDFPREGNGYSYQHCRRQWSLADTPHLRYQHLQAWEAGMLAVEARSRWLSDKSSFVSLKHEGDKVIVFEKAGLVFAFNFHPSASFTDYRIGTPLAGEYRVVLTSDLPSFGGHARVDTDVTHSSTQDPWNDRPCSMFVYLPSRSATVYALAPPGSS